MPGDPILIVGTERSGSNLVRLLLDAHPSIAVPHPPHLVRYLAPLEASYGFRGDPRAFERLVDDALLILARHIHPWDVEVDRGRLVAEADPRDLMGVYLGIMDQYREAHGKARWGCKSTFMIHHVDRVLAHRPGTRVIFLVRDPRDVAASSRRSVFGPCHPGLTARLWRAQQEEGLALLDRLPATTIRLLRYEDLLGDPRGEVERLCAYLGEPFFEGMLRFHEQRAARVTAALSESWRNTDRPVLGDNAGKFRHELTAREVRLVESVAGPAMIRLGYTPLHPDAVHSAPPPSPTLAWYLADAVGRVRVEARSLVRDRNHWRRWSRDATVAWIRLRAHRAPRPA